MTSNAGAIVQYVQHDFQNLLADITSADARGRPPLGRHKPSSDLWREAIGASTPEPAPMEYALCR